jgi:formylglycine-generating enzyme required for sulfatase activity
MEMFEVAHTQYQAIMGTNPSRFKRDALPVDRVAWDDAMEFCQKLSSKAERNVRLPTDAENDNDA